MKLKKLCLGTILNKMLWKDVPNDLTFLPIDDFFANYSFLTVSKFLESLNEGNIIVLSPHILTEVENHITKTKKEMGGLLIGKVYVLHTDFAEDRSLINITKVVPSEDFVGTPVSLKMGTSIWTQANNNLEKHEVVVGWYHSHPNLGAFFSGTDRKTQSAFFFNNYNVALVRDWIRHEEVWFEGKDSEKVGNERIFKLKNILY